MEDAMLKPVCALEAPQQTQALRAKAASSTHRIHLITSTP